MKTEFEWWHQHAMQHEKKGTNVKEMSDGEREERRGEKRRGDEEEMKNKLCSN